MQLPSLHPRRAMVSVAIACATSALAWLFSPAWFFTLPGGLLTIVLFGSTASMSNRPLRIGLNLVAMPVLLYFGAALWTSGISSLQQPASAPVRALFIFWLILLVPWLVLGPMSAMAFDGGATAEAYVFFWSAITYPVTVALAALLRGGLPMRSFFLS